MINAKKVVVTSAKSTFVVNVKEKVFLLRRRQFFLLFKMTGKSGKVDYMLFEQAQFDRKKKKNRKTFSFPL